MFKRIGLITAMIAALSVLISSPVAAQSKSDADRLFQEALELQEKARSHNDIKQAAGMYESALKIFRELKEPRGEGTTLIILGNIYKDWGEYGKAVEYLERSLAICREVKNRAAEAYLFNNLGLALEDWGKYEKAVEYYEKSLEICRELKDRRSEGEALGNLGNVLENLGRYEEAVANYEQCLAISVESKDRQNEAKALNSLGIIYGHWGRYNKAVEYFEKSLSMSREQKDLKVEAYSLNNLGQVFYHWGKYEKAVEYYEKSLVICRDLIDTRCVGTALNHLSIIHRDVGNYETASDFLEKSLAICRELKDPKCERQALNNLGIVFDHWGRYDEAVEYYEKSLVICRDLKDPKGEGQSLNNLGNIYKNWGQYDKAVEYYEKSLVICRDLKDPKGEGSVLDNLGIVFAKLGQYSKAVEYCEKSLGIRRESKDRSGENTSLNNLGLIYKDLGKYETAVGYFEKSLAICRELKDRKSEGQSLGNLGIVFYLWGQYEKAAEYFEKDLAVCREIKDPKGEEAMLNNLGNVYKKLGQHSMALDHYEKSLAICRKLKNPEGEGRCLNNIGQLYADSGQYQKALARFEQGLESLRQIGVPVNFSNALVGNLYLDMGELDKAEAVIKKSGRYESLGRLYLLKSDYMQAQSFYEKLRDGAEANRDAENFFIAYIGLGMCSETLGDNLKAEEYFRKAVDKTEEIRAGLNPAHRAEFFNVRIGGFYRTAPYDGLARVLMKLNRPSDALRESEYVKARAFAERLSKRAEGVTPQIPKTALDEDSRLNDQLTALTGNLQKAYEKQDKEAIANFEPQVKEAKEKLSVHVDGLRKQYPLFAATKYPQPMSLDQTSLKDDEFVLSYHVTDPGVIVYLTRGKRIVKALFKEIDRKELDKLVRELRETMESTSEKSEVSGESNKSDFKSARKLGDILLSDVLSDVPQDAPVVIVPDGSLGVIPFGTLVIKGAQKDPDAEKGEFFEDRNPISYYQSITALTLARVLRKRDNSGDKLLAIVDPICDLNDPRLIDTGQDSGNKGPKDVSKNLMSSIRTQSGPTFERLPLTDKLGESLRKVYPSETELYKGPDAKKSVIVNKDLGAFRSIVFGTHGYFGDDLPGIKEPVLVLTLLDVPKAQDGLLMLSEVMGLKNLNCDVAALVACQTGLGRRISGEGTMGMGRAFQYAGAKSVLMSLWNVSEIASVNLVDIFFRQLKQRKTKLEALKQARSIVRKAGYDHPYYWASFILVGEVD